MKNKPVSERVLITSTTGAMLIGITAGIFASKWLLGHLRMFS